MRPDAEAICRHFGTCGGCAYQDMDPESYRDRKRGFVLEALRRHDLAHADVAATIEIGPAKRRRATFKAAVADGEALLGFHAAASHSIVDMQECRVLTAELVRLVSHLRAMLPELLKEGAKADLYALQAENGFDVGLRGVKASPSAGAWAARLAKVLRAATLNLLRVSADDHMLLEFEAPMVAFGRAQVRVPPFAFLQPTAEGEAILQECVLGGVGRARSIADLYAGVGTFALRLAETVRVQAFDEDETALAALQGAARTTEKLKPVTVRKRDLHRVPLGPGELAGFDAVVLDPPRAGAARQAAELARSKVPRIVYVSCNPDSFARDARVLAAGGYRLGTVTPVDQFVWSSHIELVACLTRE